MSVLHFGSEHCVAVRRVGFCELGREVVGVPTLFFRLFFAHSPAWAHLCAVSERWSRQKVWRQESQRKGKKSSCWQ